MEKPPKSPQEFGCNLFIAGQKRRLMVHQSSAAFVDAKGSSESLEGSRDCALRGNQELLRYDDIYRIDMN